MHYEDKTLQLYSSDALHWLILTSSSFHWPKWVQTLIAVDGVSKYELGLNLQTDIASQAYLSLNLHCYTIVSS